MVLPPLIMIVVTLPKEQPCGCAKRAGRNCGNAAAIRDHPWPPSTTRGDAGPSGFGVDWTATTSLAR
jgi:hypothetical protein